MGEPGTDLSRWSVDHRRQFGNPPTIYLKRPQIVAPVAICDFRTDPTALLISQPPKRSLKPGPTMGGLPNALPNPALMIRREVRPSMCGLNDTTKKNERGADSDSISDHGRLPDLGRRHELEWALEARALLAPGKDRAHCRSVLEQ